MVGVIGYLNNWLWIPGLSVQTWMWVMHSKKIGNGKRVTMPMRAALCRKAIKRIEAGKWPTFFQIAAARDGDLFRAFQVIPVWVIWIVTIFVGPIDVAFVFWAWTLVLYLDDYFTDNDKWKKRWESVKNKVKWQWLPEPVPVRIPA